MAEISEDTMGGTTGALFKIYLTALSSSFFSLQSILSFTPSPTSPEITWPTTLPQALYALSTHTPAREGDCTLMDACRVFADELGCGCACCEGGGGGYEGDDGYVGEGCVYPWARSGTEEGELGGGKEEGKGKNGGEKGRGVREPGVWVIVCALERIFGGGSIN
ncbi:hypothetical protein BDQ17DRAFT_513526 [Cyathus striatus]|nr:hypothetical protein BDQ17DRAFT_513526 [Cyathus striatus]